ncbi:uncharacterized protein LOC108736646 [Agrilus planipennis]|uniref:Uncharacterized protein LOC108736646 n=1 Tax=Agrilus planipennis TaxID=224129 RepID=A0A1W4WX59_AGRPL|nr:uncharacterized protein LOC108736646 [Agrilus planipennis]
MGEDLNDILNLQYKVATSRTFYTKSIETILKKKNKLDLKRISNIQFEDWEETNIEVPQFKVPEMTQDPVIEKQRVEQIKAHMLDQIKLMKILKKIRSNKIAQLVNEL